MTASLRDARPSIQTVRPLRCETEFKIRQKSRSKFWSALFLFVVKGLILPARSLIKRVRYRSSWFDVVSSIKY